MTIVQPGAEVHPGIRAFATPGHTVGHLSFEIEGDDGLLIVGDVATVPAIFFPHPEWRFGFDADHDVAIASRKRLLDRAATDRPLMLGYHWPSPGIGYAERHGFGFQFVPTDGHALGPSVSPSIMSGIPSRGQGRATAINAHLEPMGKDK